MKKVLSLISIMAILLIALTGCVSVNYEVTLNKDGTADVAYIYGFEKETLQQLGTSAEDMTSDMKKNAETNAYEIETYSDDKIEGFKAKKHIENLSEISLEDAFGSENVKDSEENQIKIEKKGSKTLYSQKASIDLSGMDESTASMVTMKYVIKLPVKVGENNASEVSEDGKTLTWNLKAGEVNEIYFEAGRNSSSLITIIIVIAIAVVIAIVIIAILSKKQKNDNNSYATVDTAENEDKSEESNSTESKEEDKKEE